MRHCMKLLLLCVALTDAFMVTPSLAPMKTGAACIQSVPGSDWMRSSSSQMGGSSRSTCLFAENQNKKKKSGLDESVRNKLVTESIAPWRTLRLFLYVSAGSGATIGGLITLTGTIAAATANRPDLNLNTEYLNLAIDFGAAALFAVLFKLDSDKGAELNEKVLEKVERKKAQKQVVKAMREREAKLRELSLDIQISTDGATKVAKAGDLQAGAKQHMIIVVGPKKACRDALVGANLMKNDFSLSNVLVVPYDTGVGIEDSLSKPAGFGERPAYETQPFVARPTGSGWDDYIKAEMDDAVKQSGESCRQQGIAIVVRNDGQVIRRGVGTVPWRQMVDELTGNVQEELPLI